MKKEELISYVKNVIPKKGYSGSLHDEVISRAISTAVNTLFWEVFKNNPVELSQYEKPYENQTIENDMLTLPTESIQTKGRMNGVRVVAVDGKDVQFVPSTEGEMQLIEGSTMGLVDRKVRYIVRYNKVYFKNLPSDVETVNLWVLRPFHGWDDDEDFPLPSGTDEHLIEHVMAVLQGTQTVKKSNDNNPNTI